jgi:drug/metabolite transporter (DMT)-like permease
MTARQESRNEQLSGAANALAAAVLFGMSAPVAKMLLAGTGPLLLAGLLYLGAGIGVLVVGWLRGGAGASRTREAQLRGADFAFLAAIVAAGGVAAPVLMLFGLQRVSAVVGSLLLNLEAPFTILLAVVLFGEHLGRREMLGAVLVALGAAFLTYAPGDLRADLAGAVAILIACLGWAVDNTLTQRLSVRDPVALVRTKGLAAGVITVALALGCGTELPPVPYIVGGLALGFASYGLSVVLAVRALRSLGAARHAAFFATAPFVGAVAAVPLLGETFGMREAAVGGVMAVGVALLLTERHAHWHLHEPLKHEHAHVHDEHHQHQHAPSELGGEPHSHVHVHQPLPHTHPHVSDVHHRHKH